MKKRSAGWLKILIVMALAASAGRARADLVDMIWVVVGQAVVTYQQINSIVLQQNRTLLLRAHNDRETYAKLRAGVWGNVETNMINTKMILHEFESAGFKIPENIIEEYVQDEIQDRWHGDRVEMLKALELDGLTYEDLKQQLHDEFVVKIMRHKFVPEPIISPLKVENFYKEHLDDFKVKEEAKLRLIVLNKQSDDTNGVVHRRMAEILLQVKDGASFGELAKSYSEGSGRSESGETGWQELSSFDPVIVEAVNKLKPGEYSGVIESSGACFLVLLEERRAARVRPLSEMRSDIEKILIGQEGNRLAERWIARLRRKTYVGFF